jgi:hypothetical protein
MRGEIPICHAAARTLILQNRQRCNTTMPMNVWLPQSVLAPDLAGGNRASFFLLKISLL